MLGTALRAGAALKSGLGPVLGVPALFKYRPVGVFELPLVYPAP